MDQSARKITFYRHLRLFLTTCQHAGFAYFTYNPSTHKFEHSKVLYRISRILFAVCCLFSGFFFSIITMLILTGFLNTFHTLSVQKNDVIILILGRCYVSFASTFLLAENYLRHGHICVPTLNEMLSIWRALRAMTHGEIYYPARFKFLLTLKMCLIMMRLPSDILPRSMVMLCFGDISTPLGTVLMELTYLSHVFAQLVLICCYLKMNEFLASFSGVMRKREISRHILGLMSISFRVHRLKHRLNKFHSVLYFCSCLGLFSDIKGLYTLLRNLLYLRRNPEILSSPMQLFYSIVLNLMVAFSASYDIYLIGYVGGMLTRAEGLFQKKLLLLFCKQKVLRGVTLLHRNIDLMLVQDYIQDLSTEAFGLFVIDERFAFYYVRDVIIAYAIVCIQIFAIDTLIEDKGKSLRWA